MNELEKITIEDVLDGCQCAVIELLGEPTVIRCVTCPLHGDSEFRKEQRITRE